MTIGELKKITEELNLSDDVEILVHFNGYVGELFVGDCLDIDSEGYYTSTNKGKVDYLCLKTG